MYHFFMSYARTENDAYLQKFYDELSFEVRRALGKGQKETVGFFDQRELKFGALWEKEIIDAINESAAFVAVYSPAFFNSEACLTEVNTFLARTQNRAADDPEAMLPIQWYPIESKVVPAQLRKFQFRVGNPNTIVNKHGVQAARKRRNASYDDLVRQLAQQIARCSSVPQPPRVQAAVAAAPPASKPAAAAPGPELWGPNHVRFIYASATESAPEVASRISQYGPGASRWKPYYPDADLMVGPLAQGAASQQNLTSDEIAFNADLIAAVREAESRRNLVVLIVDGRSIEITSYARTLDAFDQQNFANCSVIVPWNAADPDTQQNLAALRQNVRATLPRWSGLPTRFDDAPGTLPQFQNALAGTLTTLRAQIFNSHQGRATPNVPRPILSNSSGQAA